MNGWKVNNYVTNETKIRAREKFQCGPFASLYIMMTMQTRRPDSYSSDYVADLKFGASQYLGM